MKAYRFTVARRNDDSFEAEYTVEPCPGNDAYYRSVTVLLRGERRVSETVFMYENEIGVVVPLGAAVVEQNGRWQGRVGIGSTGDIVTDLYGDREMAEYSLCQMLFDRIATDAQDASIAINRCASSYGWSTAENGDARAQLGDAVLTASTLERGGIAVGIVSVHDTALNTRCSTAVIDTRDITAAALRLYYTVWVIRSIEALVLGTLEAVDAWQQSRLAA